MVGFWCGIYCIVEATERLFFFHATRTYVRTGSQMLALEKSPEKSSHLNVGHACYLVVCFI